MHGEVTGSADRRALERELLASGCALPIDAAEEYPSRAGESRELVIVGEPGSSRWGAVVESAHSRIVPWRKIVRLIRVSGVASVEDGKAAAARIAEIGKTLRSLRTYVEIFDLDPHRRALLATELRAVGFTRASAPRRYNRTIQIDLSMDEDALLAHFHATCRRHIRSFYRKGLRIAPITDVELAPRLQVLLEESMARTGGDAGPHDWAAFIRFTERAPDRARLLGAFRDNVEGPEALVGYVVGLRHSDAVEYATAASTRLHDLKVPILYAPAWELIRWARSTGAPWFDFGGVFSSAMSVDDPRHGISEFKRMFSAVEIDVGEDYVLEFSDFTARAVVGIRDLHRRYLRIK